MKLLEKTERFKDKKIMVVGDLMLDKYIWGSVSRISPEAPVQIVNVQKETFSPGGAANVASNVAALGAETLLIGLVGKDQEARFLIRELKKRRIQTTGVLAYSKRKTTTKVRIMGKHQQLLRVDYEQKDNLEGVLRSKIISQLRKSVQKCDAAIISDYAKGIVNEAIVKELVKSKVPTVIDPKPKNQSFYKGATLITPNHKEANEMTGHENQSDQFMNAGRQLQKKLNASIIITRGERGMVVFEKKKNPFSIKAKQKEVFDVTGAGDTVTAVSALALASGATIQEAAIMANIAAGIKVGKLGTATVSPKELEEKLINEK